MKVAVASSGLGHVWRGIEAWAIDTARCLHQAGQDVTLFAAGPLSLASGDGAGNEPDVCVVHCLRRDSPKSARIMKWIPPFLWRWGLKSPYGLEQASFWLSLWPQLGKGRFDVLHVQDPMLAYWCARFEAFGLLDLKVILAHGTNEDASFLSTFEHVQSLTPWQDARTMAELPSVKSRKPARLKKSYVIPNFVDCSLFFPGMKAEKSQEKYQTFLALNLDIPTDAVVVGCVAMVTKDTKRIHYLIAEFASALRTPSLLSDRGHLVIVGARRPDTDEMMKLASDSAPGRIHFKIDVPRQSMPAIYRTFDLFVLTSLFEMMPMAVLEAMASGLPVIGNSHPIITWMLGEGESSSGGACVDMAKDGALADCLAQVTAAWMTSCGMNSLNRVRAMFSEKVVIEQMIGMYRDVKGEGRSSAGTGYVNART